MRQKELSTFLEKGLHAMLDAEHQILEGLRWMEEKATSSSLKRAFQKHEKETRTQIARLKETCDILVISYKEQEATTVQKALGKGKEILKDIVHLGATHKTEIIQALIEEGKAMAERYKDMEAETLDVALCGAAEQIELAEISAYNLLCHFATKLDEQEAWNLLHQNLDEEKRMLQSLTEINSIELMHEIDTESENKRKIAASR